MEWDNEHEKRLSDIENRSKGNAHRLDDLEKKQSDLEKKQDNLEKLVSIVNVLAVRQEAVETDIKEIKSDVKVLTSRPGERWETATEKIISAVITGFIAFIMAYLGFKA